MSRIDDLARGLALRAPRRSAVADIRAEAADLPVERVARAAAKPISRRRALRVLGGALITAAAPASLSTSARATRARAQGCTACGVPHGAGCVGNYKCGQGALEEEPVCCTFPGYFGPLKAPFGGTCAQAGGQGNTPPGGAMCCCPAGSSCGDPAVAACTCPKPCGSGAASRERTASWATGPRRRRTSARHAALPSRSTARAPAPAANPARSAAGPAAAPAANAATGAGSSGAVRTPRSAATRPGRASAPSASGAATSAVRPGRSAVATPSCWTSSTSSAATRPACPTTHAARRASRSSSSTTSRASRASSGASGGRVHRVRPQRGRPPPRRAARTRWSLWRPSRTWPRWRATASARAGPKATTGAGCGHAGPRSGRSRRGRGSTQPRRASSTSWCPPRHAPGRSWTPGPWPTLGRSARSGRATPEQRSRKRAPPGGSRPRRRRPCARSRACAGRRPPRSSAPARRR